MSTTGEFPSPSGARFKLIVVDGPMRGLEASIGPDPMVVGSDFAAHLRLPLDPAIASFHCEVRQEDHRCWVEDLGGALTQVIGKPPSNRIPLVLGDVLLVGATRLLVATDGGDRIGLLAGLHAAPTPASEEPAAAPGSGPSVLLVDDDVDFLLYVQTILQHSGYRVRSAANGLEALIRIQELRPDVVVCDLQMPEMDGLSLIRRLRARPGMDLVPLILLTGLDLEEIPERALRLGADDCLNKDHLRELKPRIQRALERRARIDTAIEQAHEGGSESAQDMVGDLRKVPVSSLLTFLQVERKSGILVVQHATLSATARLLLRDGAIVSARVTGKDDPRNAEAVYQIVEWAHGSFAFTAATVEIEDEIGVDTTHLLMQAALRRDQAEPMGEEPTD